MKESFSYYRVKTDWTKEMPDGSLQKQKTEELVYASSYTEAEKVAYSLIEQYNREKLETISDIEITKTKIYDLIINTTLDHDKELVNGLVYNFFNEDNSNGTGMYAVKVVYIMTDEKSGKKKCQQGVVYTPATSPADAIDFVTEWLHDVETRDFVIRDAKFDKAEAILLPTDVLERKSKEFAKYE